MNPKHPPGPPMDLANMRRQGAHHLIGRLSSMPTQPMSQVDTKRPEISQDGTLITPEQLLRVADAFQQKNPGLANLARFLAQKRTAAGEQAI